MTKKFNSVWRLLLGTFITLLGFGSCKTAKNVQPEDDMMVLYGAPPEIIEEAKPIKQEPIKLLYGAPPVRIEKVQE